MTPSQCCRPLLHWLCWGSPAYPSQCRSRKHHPDVPDLGHGRRGRQSNQVTVRLSSNVITQWGAAPTFIEIHRAHRVANHRLKQVQVFAALQQLLGHAFVQISVANHSLAQDDLFKSGQEGGIHRLLGDDHSAGLKPWGEAQHHKTFRLKSYHKPRRHFSFSVLMF